MWQKKIKIQFPDQSQCALEVQSDDKNITSINFINDKGFLKQNFDKKEWHEFLEDKKPGDQIRHIVSVELIKDNLRCQYIGKSKAYFDKILNDNKKSLHSTESNEESTLEYAANSIKNAFIHAACDDKNNVFFGNSDENEAAGVLSQKLKYQVVKGQKNYKGFTISDILKKDHEKVNKFMQTDRMKDFKCYWFEADHTIRMGDSKWKHLCNFFKHVSIDYDAPTEKRDQVRSAETIFDSVYQRCSSLEYSYDQSLFYHIKDNPVVAITKNIKALPQNRQVQKNVSGPILKESQGSISKFFQTGIVKEKNKPSENDGAKKDNTKIDKKRTRNPEKEEVIKNSGNRYSFHNIKKIKPADGQNPEHLNSGNDSVTSEGMTP